MNAHVISPPVDWKTPALTVFIAGSGRSGSNLLCSAMTSTGILGSPTEWLNLREMARADPAGIRTAADCCRKVATAGSTPNGIAATKLTANHYERLGGTLVLEDWFPVQSWIYLRRHDRLGQAISRALALQTGVWAMQAGFIAGREPVYARAHIDSALANIQASDDFWAGYFSPRGIRPLDLWYEDLEKDLHGEIARVADHVGGHALADDLRRTPPYVSGHFDIWHARQRSAVNAAWRVRYLRGL